MPTKEELYVIAVAAGVVLAANVLAIALFILFSKLPESRLKESIRSIIIELDRICDNMENPEKRRLAIQQINDVLGWRRILIPSALIGWIIDAEVAAIRRMQKVTDTPDLHTEEAEQ